MRDDYYQVQSTLYLEKKNPKKQNANNSMALPPIATTITTQQ